MPLNVFGNSSSSHDNGDKIDTTLLVRKLFLGTNYIESNVEEDIDIKNQYRIKAVKDPIFSIRKAASKSYVDTLFNDPSIMKNTGHVDFNNHNLDNIRLLKVTS